MDEVMNQTIFEDINWI